MLRNFLFRKINKSCKKDINLIQTLKDRTNESSINREYFITSEILKYVLYEKIKLHIMERNLFMGYIPRQNFESNHIKLYGNNNYFIDNSKWIEIVLETKLNDELNFSFSSKFMIFHQIFSHFKIQIQEDELVKLISENDLSNIEDIFNLFSELIIEKKNLSNKNI